MKTFLAIFALVLIGVAGTIGTLVALGQIDPTKLFAQEEKVAKAPVPVANDNLTEVILSVRSLPPYTRIEREHLFDPRTRRPLTVKLDLAKLPADVIVNYGDVIGRVLKRQKGPQLVFQESDFFPPGTRSGVVAAVEPGKRAIVVNADHLAGVYDLQIGDRIDVFATFKSASGAKAQGFTASEFLLTESLLAEEDPNQRKPGLNTDSQVALKRIADNAVIVKPVTARTTHEKSQATLMRAGQLQEKPVYEVTIALGAEEIPAFYEAIAMGADLHCAFRTGQPADPAEEIEIPELEAEAPIRAISVEMIDGLKRRTQSVKPTND